MKKILLLVLVSLFSFKVDAQNAKNDGKPYDFYCQIVAFENLAGQLRLKLMWDNQRFENDIRDKDGNKIQFMSIVDMLNYMSKRGWEYVESTVYSENSKQNVLHFLFKKKVTSDKEAKEGLYFKSDFEKK